MARIQTQTQIHDIIIIILRCYRWYEAMAAGSTPIVEDVVQPPGCARDPLALLKVRGCLCACACVLVSVPLHMSSVALCDAMCMTGIARAVYLCAGLERVATCA